MIIHTTDNSQIEHWLGYVAHISCLPIIIELTFDIIDIEIDRITILTLLLIENIVTSIDVTAIEWIDKSH